jgi:hypothetical protein
LETMFVELDESGAKNVGLDFTNANSQIAVATVQTGAFITNGQQGQKPLTSIALQAAVYAQVQKGHGRIVSKPRISAQSGSTAKIITGDALPILTAITLSGVNAVSQQVQYVNVGVTLQIAPRVSVDGFVTSHVFCVVSSVTGTSQGYPTISQREAETSATVRDGETFVIGGLTEESDIASNSGIPGLGGVPGLGQLFRHNSDTKSKTELYIVVTPHIVDRRDPPTRATTPVDASLTPAPAGPIVQANDSGPPSALEPAPSAPPSAPSAPPPAPSAPPTDFGAPLRGAIIAPTAAVPTPQHSRSDDAGAPGLIVQIGAFPSAALAQQGWDETEQIAPDQLAGKRRRIAAVTKGHKTFYRTDVVGFSTRTDAKNFCAALKAKGKDCIVR